MADNNLTPELSITVLESEDRPPPPRVERIYTFTQLREMFGEDEGSTVCELMKLAESQARRIAELEARIVDLDAENKRLIIECNEHASRIDDLMDAQPSPEPEHGQCEIATVEIRDGEIVSTTIKAPGLPDGLHDLFCADPREVRPLPARAAPETNAHHSPGVGNMVGVSSLHERHAQGCARMVTGSSRCTCGGGSNI